jgi:hypothetical protein
MLTWFKMLRDAPAMQQRLIARFNRISLPRTCSADVRLERLRESLIHKRTVQVTYFSLDTATRAAIQDLRDRPRGISLSDLEAHYGPVRSWQDWNNDPTPRSIAERLILLGWLVLRPASHQHPPRFLVPPEVREWLPHPLALVSAGAVPQPPPDAPILRVVTTLLLLATERPLAVRCDTLLRRSSERQVMQRLSGLNLPDEDLTAMLRWVMPLLYQLDLLEIRNGRCRPTVAGHRFLARPAEEQRMRVQQAWIGLPDVEHWVQTRVLDARTMDLPFFRRRLCAWAASLPAQQWVAVEGLHATLEAAHGPLADAHTHRFRQHRRRPWQEKRSESIWEAALRGPLTWLGIVTWQVGGQGAGERGQESHLTASPPDKVALVRSPDEVTPVEHPVVDTTEADAAEVLLAPDDVPQPDATPPWNYGAPGDVCIPHAHLNAQVLRLLPFVRWERADATTTTYRVTTDRIARAIRQGYSDTQLWTMENGECSMQHAECRAAG